MQRQSAQVSARRGLPQANCTPLGTRCPSPRGCLARVKLTAPLTAPLLLLPPLRTGHQPYKALISVPTSPLVETGLRSTDVVVAFIGASSRQDIRDAQMATLGRHYPMAYFTESSGRCVRCGDGNNAPGRSIPSGTNALFSGGVALKHFDWASFREEGWHGKPHSLKSTGWYCAQQRPLQALRALLLHPQTAQQAMPKWILLVDDDVIINPVTLLKFLADQNYNQSVVIGKPMQGGAGYIISQAAARFMISPALATEMHWEQRLGEWRAQKQLTYLDLCIQRQLGGPWCYTHSDWVMPYCVDAMNDMTNGSIRQQDAHVDILVQDCHISPKGSPGVPRADKLLTTVAVCHKPAVGKRFIRLLHEMYGQIQNMITEQQLAAPPPSSQQTWSEKKSARKIWLH
jgi:hypothetical protein